jgi:hypothetical protein
MKNHIKLALWIIIFSILGGLWVDHFTDKASEAFQWPAGALLGACIGFVMGWTQPKPTNQSNNQMPGK